MELYEILNQKSSEELKAYVTEDGYRPEAIEIAKQILQERGEEIPEKRASAEDIDESSLPTPPQGIKYYFSFVGRIGRGEYIVSYIVTNAVVYLLEWLIRDDSPIILTLLALALCFLSFWILWAQGAKRCHDLGNSGWFQLIPLYFLWMFFAPGEEKANKYGKCK